MLRSIGAAHRTTVMCALPELFILKEHTYVCETELLRPIGGHKTTAVRVIVDSYFVIVNICCVLFSGLLLE